MNTQGTHSIQKHGGKYLGSTVLRSHAFFVFSCVTTKCNHSKVSQEVVVTLMTVDVIQLSELTEFTS